MRHRAAVATIVVCLALFAAPQVRAEPSAAQAARLAQLRPDSVQISRGSDKVFIRGGDLGHFDARVAAVDNLRKLIVHLGLLHEPAQLAEFTVAEQTATFVRFTQVIHGVPVRGRNEIDLGPDGRVLEARLSVVDPGLAPKAQSLTRERAMQIASLTYATQAGVAAAAVKLDDFPGLHYEPAALGEPLTLEYRFAAEIAGRTSDFVTVDAITGSVEVASAVLP